MKPLNVELLVGHSTGLKGGSCYKPTEQEVLADYLKAVDLLTINYDVYKPTLQKQVTELKEKNKDESFVIRGKLAEKEREIETLARENQEFKNALADQVEERQRQWEEKMVARTARQERLYDEVMRLSESWLIQIKDKIKREEEMNALDIVGVDVMWKIESGEM